ncbi:MAG: transcriptional activator NhaR [Myxococcota bacterium]
MTDPWLNFHHLKYFWMVVREGGILPAAKRLRLKHPTVSAQIKALEESLGEPLFDRSRRRLELTEFGHLAYSYAEDIFRLGDEFMEAIRLHDDARPLHLVVGATGAIPKAIVRRLLMPALTMQPKVRLRCREDEHDRLLALLASHEVDVVLSDMPLSPASNVKAFNHLLGKSGMSFFASEALTKTLDGRFPNCLDGAPFIAPLPTSAMGRALASWMDEREIRPVVVAEVQDSALIKSLGQKGIGAFCMPSILEKDVEQVYGVKRLGRSRELSERFYAISPERRLRHPAVVAICDQARRELSQK